MTSQILSVSELTHYLTDLDDLTQKALRRIAGKNGRKQVLVQELALEHPDLDTFRQRQADLSIKYSDISVKRLREIYRARTPTSLKCDLRKKEEVISWLRSYEHLEQQSDEIASDALSSYNDADNLGAVSENDLLGFDTESSGENAVAVSQILRFGPDKYTEHESYQAADISGDSSSIVVGNDNISVEDYDADGEGTDADGENKIEFHHEMEALSTHDVELRKNIDSAHDNSFLGQLSTVRGNLDTVIGWEQALQKGEGQCIDRNQLSLENSLDTFSTLPDHTQGEEHVHSSEVPSPSTDSIVSESHRCGPSVFTIFTVISIIMAAIIGPLPDQRQPAATSDPGASVVELSRTFSGTCPAVYRELPLVTNQEHNLHRHR